MIANVKEIKKKKKRDGPEKIRIRTRVTQWGVLINDYTGLNVLFRIL